MGKLLAAYVRTGGSSSFREISKKGIERQGGMTCKSQYSSVSESLFNLPQLLQCLPKRNPERGKLISHTLSSIQVLIAGCPFEERRANRSLFSVGRSSRGEANCGLIVPKGDSTRQGGTEEMLQRARNRYPKCRIS